MTPKSKLWIAAGLVLILLAAASILANTIYFPQMPKYPTTTPTLTPTATHTVTATPTKSPTPTRTPTPVPGVVILDIVYAPSIALDEYVLIENSGNNSVDMEGWWIKADSGAKYDFPDNFSLGSDKAVKVWTKVGQDTSSNLYWDRTEEAWNNNGDTGYLKDKDGDLVDSFTYGDVSLSP